MLAAPVRIDRPVKGNIRRLVARDDGLGLLFKNRGFERRQFRQRFPAVIEKGNLVFLVTALVIGARPAPPHLLRQGRESPGTRNGGIEGNGGSVINQSGHG